MQEIKEVRYHEAMKLLKSCIKIVGFMVCIVSVPIGVIILIMGEVVSILETTHK